MVWTSRRWPSADRSPEGGTPTAVARSTAGDPHPVTTPTPWLVRLLDGTIWLFALVVVAIFRVVDGTLDLEIFGHEHASTVLRGGRRMLIVVWHGHGLLPIFFFQGYPLVIYCSQPRLGSMPLLSRATRKLTLAALSHLGYHVLDAAQFASESRGVIRFVHFLSHTSGGVIAADGPGGPIFRAKPGAAYLAKKTGVTLLPVASAMRDAIALDSWDRFEIPRPFTKAVLEIGDGLDVPEEIPDDQLELLSGRLERVLNALTATAEAEVLAPPRTKRPPSQAGSEAP